VIPCQADPAAFDLDLDRPTTRTVAELQQACMGCPLLRACRDQYDAAPAGRFGVTAGIYRPHPLPFPDGSADANVPTWRLHAVLVHLEHFLDIAAVGHQLPSSRELVRATGQYAQAVVAALHQLEMQGRVSPSPHGTGLPRYVLPNPQLTQPAQLAAAS